MISTGINMKKVFGAGVLMILIFTGCYNDKADKLYPNTSTGCDTTAVTFQKTILPIMTASCGLSGCHDANTPSNGYNFTTYEGTRLAVTNNRMLGAIKHESGYQAMPKGMPKLDECSIAKIDKWVTLGAKND